MKKILYLVIALSLLCVAPIYAQGAFTDVPSEHWAYDAVELLQSKGIVQGYPDGTYQGKRTMSRYELATVIARVLQQIQPPPPPGGKTEPQDLSAYAKTADVNSQIEALKGLIPGNVATKDDIAALRKLIDGFKDELQSLGVDVDQAKRDIAALSARVDAIEAELRRVRFTGTFNVMAKMYNDNTCENDFIATGAQIIDKDGRPGNPTNRPGVYVGSGPLRDINVYRDFDLNLVGRVNENTTAMATITFGNYLNYLDANGDPDMASDSFVPYYMAIATDLGFGNLTVGRFPLQLGNYLLKMPVADSYVSLAKTDSGNRPVDGAMLKMGALGLDWTWFAAQHEKVPSYAGYPAPGMPMMVTQVPFTQSAGVQLGFNAPANIRLVGTYYQGWDKNNYKSAVAPDLTEIMGVDVAVPIPFLGGMDLTGSWAKTRQKLDGTRIKNQSDEAWEGRLAVPLGGLKIGVGYRNIGNDFCAPGAWDKIANYNNPTNIKGFNGDLAYSFSDKLSVNVGGEFLKLRENGGFLGYAGLKDDMISKVVGGVNYAYSSTDNVGVDVEFDTLSIVRPAKDDNPTFSYVTLGWGRKLGDNANLKLGYQLIEFKSGVKNVAATNSYKGSMGVVQLGVSF